MLDSFTRSIPREEVSFHPHSFADPSGRVFRWGDGLYRGISAEWKPFLLNLFQQGVIENLTKKGLFIDTKLTDYRFDEYPLVVQHRSVPFISYPHEWCPAMLKAAALEIIDLAIELSCCDLTLKDAHPWNVLFDSCKPIFVDLGSILPTGEALTWPAYAEFSRYCLYPLILMAHGHDRIARLLIDELEGVQKNELFKLAPQFVWLSYPSWSVECFISSVYNRVPFEVQRLSKRGQGFALDPPLRHLRNQKLLTGFLKKVRKQVESIAVSRYEDNGELPAGQTPQNQEPDSLNKMRRESIRQVLTQLRPHSVLDVFGVSDWYAKQASLLGSQVVAFNTNLGSVTRLYRESCEKNDSILPLVIDFSKPTPPRGLGNHWSLAATDRFQCEMVLAVGFADTPALTRRISFEQVVNGLDQFTRRWLVIELISDTDLHAEKLADAETATALLASYLPFLEKKFQRISRISSASDHRVLLLCEK